MPEKNKNIVIVCHKNRVQLDDDLVAFLNKKKFSNVLQIRHSFSDAPDRCSSYLWYKDGELYKSFSSKDYQKWGGIFVYLKEFYFTWQGIMLSGIIWDKYIGLDGLCIFFGLWLRFLSQVGSVVYWVVDFVPTKRFNNSLENRIYRLVNKIGYKRSDIVWDISPRIAAAREKFLNIKPEDIRSLKIVPYGAWLDRIKIYTYDLCEKNTLVFMGHLTAKQGVQLIISALPEIIKTKPDFRFKIIGTGGYEDGLRRLAIGLNVLSYCDFRGAIEDAKEMEMEIARSCLAVAPYIKELDTFTFYADPGKIKTYLACGVPVLLTDLPWNAGEIESGRCGRVITEVTSDIVSAVIDLMDPEKNSLYRVRAREYARNFDYKNIFEKLDL